MKNLLSLSLLLIVSGITFGQDFSFIHGGVERTYRVFVPSDYSAETEYPMVINMHGAGSNAVEQQYYSQMDSIAEIEKFIVVYPNAINGFWNIYSESGADDVGFNSALIDTMSVNYSVDTKRVYSTGMSMGGFMSYRLACQLNNKIAAIGSVAGVMAYSSCAPDRPVPVCHIHGTADSTVLYSLVSASVAFWTANNGCTDSVVVDLPDVDMTDQSVVTMTTYNPCTDDAEFVLYTINGGGHSWSGASYIIDITNQDIHASVEMWKFFSKYTLPDYSAVDDPFISKEELKVYPNPVVQTAVIELPESRNSSWILQFRDISGRLLKSEKYSTSNNKITFSREGLKGGIYVIELVSDKVILRKKVIIN